MPVIRTARVIPSSRDAWPGKARVLAKFEGEEQEREVFDFYDDELTFVAEEFVGLTEEQAHDLFRKKDTAYLRS